VTFLRSDQLLCMPSYPGTDSMQNAVANLTLKQKLSPTSSIHSYIKSLLLFNLLVGDNDLSGDIDSKHIFKRFRNTLLRKKGVTLGGTYITPELIKLHLTEANLLTAPSAAALLNPSDKQDVVLMVRLLNAIRHLPPPTPEHNPGFAATREALHLLGNVYSHLLLLFIKTLLSLQEQLVHLSAAGHLLLQLYHTHKGDFIPSQLMFDTAVMIKNAFLCVAKTKVDNPSGKFYLCQLGDDCLEDAFGIIWTMVGNDTNVDQLQLTSRISATTECTEIVEVHPKWDCGPCRL
jgi:hypothetical protein